MYELLAEAVIEAALLYGLHQEIKNYFGAMKRKQLKARLRGCL